MLSEVFYWVINMSIVGSLCGIILLALRKIKSIPRFAVYLLWLIPLIRFWIPFGLGNKYSLLSFLSRFTTKTLIIWQDNTSLTMTNSIMGAKSYFPIEYKTDLLTNIFNFASIIWAVVAIVCMVTEITLYFHIKSELKDAEHVKDNIYKSEIITVPAVYGVFRPKIIIPAVLIEGEIDYIVMHEKVHIGRKDNLWRVVSILTACLHWFNPFAWLFLKTFFSDMELACDSKVLKTADSPKKYASAVLSAAQGKVFFASAFGGAKTKARIENILSYKRITIFSSVCFSILLIAIAIVLITNAA